MTPETAALLAWYDQQGRDLPWRVKGVKKGGLPDPYRVWVSEIMLQQTTVATVIPYFEAFMNRWPTIEALAAASLDDVLHAWQGLGYYSRARNLHACAQEIAWQHDGRFPSQEKELLRLPGIGPYTAAALTTIAFNKPAIAIDGNILRVFARFYRLEAQGGALKEAVHQRSAGLLPLERSGDYTQALMDLGALICRPRQPLCPQCPWNTRCQALKQGDILDFPRLPEKKALPLRHGFVFWAQRPDSCVLLEKREAKGLLGGLMAFPSTPWTEGKPSLLEGGMAFPVSGRWHLLPGQVSHTFTHFKLFLQVWRGDVPLDTSKGVWVFPNAFKDYAFSTLMRKVMHHVEEKDLSSHRDTEALALKS